MALEDLILSLIADIRDPAVRMDIAATVMLMRDAYLAGTATEEDVRASLVEVIETVLEVKEPLLSKEEIRERAKDLVEQYLRAIKISTLRMRMLRERGMRF